MESWTYDDYKSSINNDLDFGLSKREYSASEAIGFAHAELAMRFDEFPSEQSMALIALAVCGIERGGFTEYIKNDFFVLELKDAVNSQNIQSILNMLPRNQADNFLKEVERVKDGLSVL